MQVGTFFERRPGARDAEYAPSCDDQERSSFLEMRAAILNGVPLFRIEMPKGSFMIPNRYKAVQRITLRWHTQ